MEFLVSEGMSEGTWPFLGQKNSYKISSGPTSGESSTLSTLLYTVLSDVYSRSEMGFFRSWYILTLGVMK